MKIRYGRGNVRSGKCLSGEMSSRGSVLRGSVRSGNCPFGEMSVGEVSVGELSSGKCPPGNCPTILFSSQLTIISSSSTIFMPHSQVFVSTSLLALYCKSSKYRINTWKSFEWNPDDLFYITLKVMQIPIKICIQ